MLEVSRLAAAAAMLRQCQATKEEFEAKQRAGRVALRASHGTWILHILLDAPSYRSLKPP